MTSPFTGLIVTKRRDGLSRVVFQVSKNRRPSGWAGYIPLPLGDSGPVDLGDPDVVARLQADAAMLKAWLARERRAQDWAKLAAGQVQTKSRASI